MTTLKISLEFEVSLVPKERCDKLKKPYGTIEVLDDSGYRIGFANNKDEAVELVQELIGSDFEINPEWE